jgi:hypothetical protein
MPLLLLLQQQQASAASHRCKGSSRCRGPAAGYAAVLGCEQQQAVCGMYTANSSNNTVRCSKPDVSHLLCACGPDVTAVAGWRAERGVSGMGQVHWWQPLATHHAQSALQFALYGSCSQDKIRRTCCLAVVGRRRYSRCPSGAVQQAQADAGACTNTLQHRMHWHTAAATAAATHRSPPRLCDAVRLHSRGRQGGSEGRPGQGPGAGLCRNATQPQHLSLGLVVDCSTSVLLKAHLYLPIGA